jgi:hypothetical protein
VILGKNVGVLLFESLILLECLVVWSLVKGPPGITVILCGVLVFSSGVLALMIPGNFVSIAHPVKRSISALTNSASNLGSLVSFGGTAVTAGVVGGLLVFGLFIGGELAQLVLLILLLGTLSTIYAVLLESASDLFEERKESLLEVLSGDSES